jgi:mono/diheme cytochrome c family protein
MFTRRLVWKGLLVAAVLMVVIQVVPYGRTHSNPSARTEPAWDRAETGEMVRRACFDCHSNETVWPGYAQIAPMSWLIQRDVDEGRQMLNFSEWQRPQEEAQEAAESVEKGEMPPWTYTLLHPRARLSADERLALIKGLEATIAAQASERSGH